MPETNKAEGEMLAAENARMQEVKEVFKLREESQSAFDKRETFHIGAGDFDALVERLFGHNPEVEACEQYMYESAIQYNVEADNEGDKDYIDPDVEEFLETGDMGSGATTLLNHMCSKGFIVAGEYFIHSDS